jgi:hypothetical protein
VLASGSNPIRDVFYNAADARRLSVVPHGDTAPQPQPTPVLMGRMDPNFNLERLISFSLKLDLRCCKTQVV